MSQFRIEPRGPFVLEAAQDFAGGFAPGLGGHPAGISQHGLLMAFPVEGWRTSVAVDLWQDADGIVLGEASGADGPLDPVDLEAAQEQAARSVSLDHDGSAWPDVGVRDPVIGALQARFSFLRPVCFYSAYEAATSLVIGQRISMAQGAAGQAPAGRRVRATGSRSAAAEVHAFPRPQCLLEVEAIPGLATLQGDSTPRAGARRHCPDDWTRRHCARFPRTRHWRGCRRSPGSGRGRHRGSSCAAAALRTRCRRRTRSAARPSGRRTACGRFPTTRRGFGSLTPGAHTGCGRRCCCTWRGAATRKDRRVTARWVRAFRAAASGRTESRPTTQPTGDPLSAWLASDVFGPGWRATPSSGWQAAPYSASGLLLAGRPAAVVLATCLAPAVVHSTRTRLRSRIDFGVTSTSSSAAMNSIADSRVERRWRRQAQRLVVAVRPDVGELLFLGRVDVHVARSAVLADDHPLVDLLAGPDRTSSTRSWRLNSP